MSTSATQIGHKKYKHYESKLTATMHDLWRELRDTNDYDYQ